MDTDQQSKQGFEDIRFRCQGAWFRELNLSNVSTDQCVVRAVIDAV